MRSSQLGPLQAESVFPIGVLRRFDQKVAGRICSECKLELHRLRTRLDQGRSAVDRPHQAIDHSMRRRHLTLTFCIDIVRTQ